MDIILDNFLLLVVKNRILYDIMKKANTYLLSITSRNWRFSPSMVFVALSRYPHNYFFGISSVDIFRTSSGNLKKGPITFQLFS